MAAVPIVLGDLIPLDMAEFEPPFQGLRKRSIGEDRAAISSYAEWKADALGELAIGYAQIQALIQDEQTLRGKQPINGPTTL